MSALAPALTAPVLRLERKLARDLRAMTDAALAPVRNLVADLDSGDPLTSAKAGRLLLAIERLEKRPPLAKVAIRRVSVGLAEIAGHGLAQSRQEVRQAVGFAKSPPGVLAADVDYYHTAAAAMVDRLQADTYAAVRQRVERGLQRGETDAEIGQRILGLGTELTPAHCDTWAVTETTRFYTLGRVRGIEEAGDYVWGYEYAVIVDNVTTAICRQFIGKRVAKAAMTRFPPFHFRCRTTVTATMSGEVTGEDPQPRGTQLPVRLAPAPQDGFGGDPREYLPERKAKPLLRRRARLVEVPPTPPPAPEPFLPPPEPAQPKWSQIEPMTADHMIFTDLHAAEPTWANPGPSPAYGAVLFDDEGRVLLREPTNHFDGYHWTWPKGKQTHPGATPWETARQEVKQETGHSLVPLGLVPGGHGSGSGSKAFMFIGRSAGHAPDQMDHETASTRWVTIEQARELIKQSTNPGGVKRDLAILHAAATAHQQLLDGTADHSHLDSSLHPLHKPAPPPKPPAAPQPAAPAAPVTPPAPATSRWPAHQSVAMPATLTLHDGVEARQVAGAGGSNPGGWYRTAAGDEYYVKAPHTPAQVAAELASRALAKLIKLGAPDGHRLTLPDGGVAVASPRLPITQLTGAQLAAQPAKARAEQLVHAAWVMNWDVAGMHHDNLVQVAGGGLQVVDHGGAFLWKATGGLKPKEFGYAVPELQTLRDAATNRQTAEVFGDLTDEQVAKAVKARLGKVSEKSIRATLGAHLDGLSPGDRASIVTSTLARRKTMLAWADDVLGQVAPPAVAGRIRPPRGVSGQPPTAERVLNQSARRNLPGWLAGQLHQGAYGHAGDPSMSPEYHWTDEPQLSRAEVRERKIGFMREMGVRGSTKQLDDTIKALEDWSDGAHNDPRNQALANRYIEAMPGYRGTIYRGVNYMPLDAHGYPDPRGYRLAEGQTFREGEVVRLSKVECFSGGGSDISHGRSMLIVVERSTRGASIRGMASKSFHHEDEVLFSNDTKLRVKRIERTIVRSGERKTIVVCEEVEPLT